MSIKPLVQLDQRELSLLIRGLRAVEQQTVAHPAENREVQDLRRRLTSVYAMTKGDDDA